MAHVLLTFLGRVSKSDDGRYRQTRYDFGDGAANEQAAFFGWPLQRRLRPDKLVVFGTAGSMWDHLFEGDLDFGETAEEARLALVDAVAEKQVLPEHLAPLAPLLADRVGCEVQLQLIPYCRDAAEQVQLLATMAEQVADGDRVDLDVTHGFRHLPMLALLSALQLQMLRDARIGGIWYGAYDPDTDEAPVHNLVDLLHITKWLQALHTYDKDGDYGAFAPLLGKAGELLDQAAFFERTSNAVKAREQLTAWVNRADAMPPDDPAAALFGPELQQRVSWYRAPDRATRESALAKLYLERKDYVRAAIYGQESLITAEVDHDRGNLNDYQDRQDARLRLRDAKAFKQLGQLRNALAHGVLSSDKWAMKTVGSQDKLEAALRDLFKTLH